MTNFGNPPWRSERDLNPRYELPRTNALAGRPLRPLEYHSICGWGSRIRTCAMCESKSHVLPLHHTPRKRKGIFTPYARRVSWIRHGHRRCFAHSSKSDFVYGHIISVFSLLFYFLYILYKKIIKFSNFFGTNYSPSSSLSSLSSITSGFQLSG